MATALPSFPARNQLTDFFRGFVLPFRAAGLMFRTRKLFLLGTVASLVTFVSLVAIVILLGAWTDDFVQQFIFEKPDSWYGQLAFWVLVVVTFLLMLVVAVNTIPALLLSPLQDPISEATEEACGDFRAPPFTLQGLVRGTWVALGHTLVRIVYLMLGHLALFALNLIPGIGSVLWTVTSILWTMGWLATEYLDAPMARHLYRFRDVRKAVMARLPLCMGFGAAVYLLLWVPILNFFFIPVAIVGGTLLFRGMRACGALGLPESPSLRAA